MRTFNLVTLLGDQVSGLEPIVCADQREAIAYSCGVLTERTKSHGEMFAGQGVRWIVEEGERSLRAPSLVAGPLVGTWKVMIDGGGDQGSTGRPGRSLALERPLPG